jgi:hypothetical protein
MISESDTLRIKNDAFIAQDALQSLICSPKLHENYVREKLTVAKECIKFIEQFEKEAIRLERKAIRHMVKAECQKNKLQEIVAEGMIYTSDNLAELTKKMNVQNKKRERLKRPSAINNRLKELGLPFAIKITEDKHRHKQYRLILDR